MKLFSAYLVESSLSELSDLDSKKKKSDDAVSFVDFDYKKGIANFTCGKYDVKIQIAGSSKKSLSGKEVYDEILKSKDVKVDCSCKDFLFSGAKYNNWNIGTGIYKEERPPVKKDANNDNYLCKHLNAVIDEIKS